MLEISSPAPDFTLPQGDGTEVTLAFAYTASSVTPAAPAEADPAASDAAAEPVSP